MSAESGAHTSGSVPPPLATGRQPLNYESSVPQGAELASNTGATTNGPTQTLVQRTASQTQKESAVSPTSSSAGAGAKADNADVGSDDNSDEVEKRPGMKGNGPFPFEHSFWDPRLKDLRKAYFIPVIMVTVLMMIVVWAMMSIYWGSLWREIPNSPNLRVMVVNYDAGQIGQTLVQTFNQSNSNELPHPTYVIVDPADYPNDQAVQEAIEPNEEYWGAVTIMQNATDKLASARASGDQSWDPTAVVTIMYATARNYAVVPSIVLSPTQRELFRALAQLNPRLTGDFLHGSDANAISTAANAPQTLANPVSFRLSELRPWDHSVAIAPTFVGLIYLVILTFQITMASFAARQPIQKFLHVRSIIAMRIVTPIVAYIPISLMYTLLNVPFKVPYGRVFPYGGGVMVWWCVSYCGMLVMGLVMESVITMMGPKFIGIFLVFFIISNVSVSVFPLDLSPSFYKYGYAMPFYNLRAIYLTVLFNVGKHVLILKYIGILWAWLALIFLTFPVVIWWDHRRRHHDYKKKVYFSEGPP